MATPTKYCARACVRLLFLFRTAIGAATVRGAASIGVNMVPTPTPPPPGQVAGYIPGPACTKPKPTRGC